MEAELMTPEQKPKAKPVVRILLKGPKAKHAKYFNRSVKLNLSIEQTEELGWKVGDSISMKIDPKTKGILLRRVNLE